MMRFPREPGHQVGFEQARLVRIEDEAARRGFPLKRRQGRELVGPCPICRDGDDRFSVNVKNQLWHCRRCDAGGDVIKLVEMADRLGFREAVEKLAGNPPAAPKRAPVQHGYPTTTKPASRLR